MQAVADLVGAASLPDHERVVLLTGRLLREAVLQQNALSDNDAWCAAAKQAAPLELVLDLHDRATRPRPPRRPGRAHRGARPVAAVRARDASAPTTPPACDAVRGDLLARLEALA